MSGGVDSSVAAALLADEGHDVIGISMQLHNVGAASPHDDFASVSHDIVATGSDDASGRRMPSFGGCCSLEDLHDARRVAAALNIPYYMMNFERQFNDQVVSNFVREYASGRTPLPCAHCNSDLKFATLVERARAFGADSLATGHYARVERDWNTGRFLLKRAADATKDQSYFLFSLNQDQLSHALFPVGDRSKAAVRDYARQRRLPVADKPDSQELCFIPDNDYASFVTSRAPDVARAGLIVDEHDRRLGTHDGVHRFTIGQRKGLGLSSSATPGRPLYVLKINPAERQVVVGPKASLERTTLTASHVNWIVDEPACPIRAEVQIRYRHRAAPATVRSVGRSVEVVFDTPQIAVTPGQAVVFYDGDTVLGGGWID
ncbi:MAG TPA: tRNA 2-thiouridine(34) synthase MnmA [Vicinamibacterales bacterium]|nr:tRNA 2-thiouridine(34) synthase MnmA [Vicinamibacterales bacterium]